MLKSYNLKLIENYSKKTLKLKFTIKIILFII